MKQLCSFCFFFWNNFHVPISLRLREQRKDLVASVDKKLPNGFLEDQGKLVVVLSIFIDYIFRTNSMESTLLVIRISLFHPLPVSLHTFFFLEQTVVLLPRSPSPSKRYFPIPLDSLEEEFRLRMADDGKLFREEFNVGA